MNFTFSGWLVADAAIVVILPAFVLYVSKMLGSLNPDRAITTNYWRIPRRKWLVGATCMYVLMNLVSLTVSSATTDYRASSQDVTAAFGLVSGKSYDLKLGSRVGGASVNAGSRTVSGGFFFIRSYSSFSAKPASAISIGFAHGDKSYILELPMSRITFVQSETAEPSVVVYIYDQLMYYYEQDGVNLTVKRECEPFSFHNLLLTKACDSHVAGVHVSSTVERRGLAPIVNEYFDSATITLTPEMYDQLLGTP